MNEDARAIGEVVDLFCGVGALSHGLLRAGLTIKAGYDVDRNCKYAYEKNNKATFYARDVAKLTTLVHPTQFIWSHSEGGVYVRASAARPHR